MGVAKQGLSPSDLLGLAGMSEFALGEWLGENQLAPQLPMDTDTGEASSPLNILKPAAFIAAL